MGRAKKTAVIGKLRLRYEKKNFDSSKSYPIYYEYNYDRRVIKKSSPFKARVKDWNENANGGRGGLRASYGDDYTRDTNRMLHFLSETDDKIREYAEKHPGKLNEDIIRSLLNNAPLTRTDEGKDFVEFVIEDLEARYTANKIKWSRYENGISGMRIFQEFLRATGKGTYKEDCIYLGEISGELIDDYISYRKKIKQNENSTINHALTPIITACKKAALRNYIAAEVYDEIKDKRLTEDASSIDDEIFDGKYLTKEDFGKLIDFYNTDTEQRRKEFIEMFLFSFHACGLRLVDVMTLQWKHIDFERKELKKVLIKTIKYQKQRNTIPLTPPAIKILEKWQGMGRRERFVFDLVKDDLNIADGREMYLARNNADKKVNQALKVVGKKIGLPFNLSFHCARHSFAINALNDKEHPLDMYQVSRLLGHSSTETTEKVYADYVVETLDEKVKGLNFNFLPEIEKNSKKD